MPVAAIVPAVIMFVFAALLSGLGFWAYSNAAPGSNPQTALIVTLIPAGLSVILGVLTLFLGKSGKMAAARNAVTVGALVAMLLAGAAGGRIYPAKNGQKRHVEAKEQWDRSISEKKRPDTPENRKAFFESMDAKDHDTSYLINALLGVTGASIAACFLLFATRPKA
jgi:uncharacterized membrane protein YebE (DUF533 family)